ncbi:uncharacterized protein LOC128240089 [Mya arenaria]|uniref:uncharacterized protein LOC128240089 n=1 Tax=Mya arenaria TaxID=6604 RepID=UPI0022E149BA|nr:uncharacterized protein LOC128240089 [Mya arenaria]
MSDIKNLKEDSETSPISPKEDENYEEENNPKLVDMIPVFSQVKSFIQWTRGDSSRARRTQQNFSRQCPGISQVRSLVEVAKGDTNSAMATQKQCGRAVSHLLDTVPIVGHLKGVVHHAAGDKEGGNRAIQTASYTITATGDRVAGVLAGATQGAISGASGLSKRNTDEKN